MFSLLIVHDFLPSPLRLLWTEFHFFCVKEEVWGGEGRRFGSRILSCSYCKYNQEIHVCTVALDLNFLTSERYCSPHQTK